MSKKHPQSKKPKPEIVKDAPATRDITIKQQQAVMLQEAAAVLNQAQQQINTVFAAIASGYDLENAQLVGVDRAEDGSFYMTVREQ